MQRRNFAVRLKLSFLTRCQLVCPVYLLHSLPAYALRSRAQILHSCSSQAVKHYAVSAIQNPQFLYCEQVRPPPPAAQSSTPAPPDDAFWDKRNAESSNDIRTKLLQPSQPPALAPPPPPPHQHAPVLDGGAGGASPSPFGLVGNPPPEETSATFNQTQNSQVSCGFISFACPPVGMTYTDLPHYLDVLARLLACLFGKFVGMSLLQAY